MKHGTVVCLTRRRTNWHPVQGCAGRRTYSFKTGLSGPKRDRWPPCRSSYCSLIAFVFCFYDPSTSHDENIIKIPASLYPDPHPRFICSRAVNHQLHHIVISYRLFVTLENIGSFSKVCCTVISLYSIQGPAIDIRLYLYVLN